MSLRMAEEVSNQVPADDFQALEDKVYRTIELYKAAREARSVAERDVRRLREQIDDAVRPILETKIRFGLFEHPYIDESHIDQVLNDPAHQQQGELRRLFVLGSVPQHPAGGRGGADGHADEDDVAAGRR